MGPWLLQLCATTLLSYLTGEPNTVLGRFVEYLRTKAGEEAVTADVIVRRDARECVICQGELSIGMTVTRMPCQVQSSVVFGGVVLDFAIIASPHLTVVFANTGMLPEQHLFHTGCLHQWLQIGNSCPICRVEIPAKASASRGTFANQTAQQRGDFAWSDWVS